MQSPCTLELDQAGPANAGPDAFERAANVCQMVMGVSAGEEFPGGQNDVERRGILHRVEHEQFRRFNRGDPRAVLALVGGSAPRMHVQTVV
jgi:hypothetical protein